MGVDREFGRLLQTTTYQLFRGNLMSKLLTAVLSAALVAATFSPFAVAQEKKAKSDPVAAACKGKKPGDMVKVDGKDVKCPAPKAAPK
jgi:hypothetical protein